MFRYERPQKGRYRQFHQITIENLGAASIAYDVQMIKMLDRYFHEQLNLNNYALMINFLGSPTDRQVFKDELKKFLDSPTATGICELCKVRKEKNIMRIFDCKTPACQVIYQQAPIITDYLSLESAQRWQQLQDQLALLSISFAHNPFLVRGLDYYNDTVFEFASKNLGAQNAFCAGGRYDGLAAQLGYNKPLPSVGASIGIERLLLLLEPMRAGLPIPQSPPLHMVMPLALHNQMVALFIADLLQAQGFCVDVLLEGDSLKSMMRQANRMGAKYALLIGDEEQQTRTVTVKDMLSGTQERISQIELINYLKK
jgi:histidyl-tRNA synthetase